MYTVDLSLVELGIHQELVAYVADQQDCYAEEGVQSRCETAALGTWAASAGRRRQA